MNEGIRNEFLSVEVTKKVSEESGREFSEAKSTISLPRLI